eukprot:15071210-Alexandrium_andersonii.AAC.1
MLRWPSCGCESAFAPGILRLSSGPGGSIPGTSLRRRSMRTSLAAVCRSSTCIGRTAGLLARRCWM